MDYIEALNRIFKGNIFNILDSIHSGILIVDAHAVVRYVNSEYLRITNIESGSILGKDLSQTRPGAQLPAVVKAGKAKSGVYRKTGDTEYIVDMSPLVVDQSVVGGISIVRDITEIQRLSQELKKIRLYNKELRKGFRQIYSAKYVFEDVAGRSKAIIEAVQLARHFASRNVDILITGESGTGKELFAQSIHNASERASGPFIALNCASLAYGVLESELFGYTDGAFTGAKRGGKEGFFTVAEGGTLFLDEINELSAEGQSKLLRVLQERMVRPVGHTAEKPMDVRVIAATNRNLEALVEGGYFRHDLYYRLNVLHLELPPLRAREGDVVYLSNLFAQRITGKQIRIDNTALDILTRYSWPGNVRELFNTIQHAILMSNGDSIEYNHLQKKMRKEYIDQPIKIIRNTEVELENETLASTVAKVEITAIHNLLNRYGYSLKAKKIIAKELGISLATLYGKLKKYKLSTDADVDQGYRI